MDIPKDIVPLFSSNNDPSKAKEQLKRAKASLKKREGEMTTKIP